MEKTELKEVRIKNLTCYYSDDIIKFKYFKFDNILICEKSYKNILIYDILCKNLIGAKPLHIMFDKVNGFIRVYDKTKYLILFGLEKYDAIYDRIIYLISLKSGITYVFSHNYAKIEINSDDNMPLQTMTLHNEIILIKSVFNKDQNHYYYNIFLEKYSYQSAKK